MMTTQNTVSQKPLTSDQYVAQLDGMDQVITRLQEQHKDRCARYTKANDEYQQAQKNLQDLRQAITGMPTTKRASILLAQLEEAVHEKHVVCQYEGGLLDGRQAALSLVYDLQREQAKALREVVQASLAQASLQAGLQAGL
jgi:hypothetical protein